MILHLLLIIPRQRLEAKLAGRHLLGRLLGCAVGVHGHACSRGFLFLVFELAAVFVCDGHFGGG